MEFLLFIIVTSMVVFIYKYHTASFSLKKDSKAFIDPSAHLTKPTDISLMSKDSKQSYLKSAQWHKLKQQRLSIANYKCEHCSSSINLHLHHITYERLGNEDIKDVIILCSICHNNLHKITGKDRLTIHHPVWLKLTPK